MRTDRFRSVKAAGLAMVVAATMTGMPGAAIGQQPGYLGPGEQLGTNHFTFGFGVAGQGANSLSGTGMRLHGAFAWPPGDSLRFHDGAGSQAAGTYDIAVKNRNGEHPEQVTAIMPSTAPPVGGARFGGGTFDGTAAWLGHSRFRHGYAPAVGSASPPATGTLWNNTIGPAERATDIRADDPRLVGVPVVQNQLTTRRLLVSAQVYTPRHNGTGHQIRPQPFLAREGGGSYFGLTGTGGLGLHQVDLSAVLDQWALLQVRAEITTNGGALPGPSDDSGQATLRYFLNGAPVAEASVVPFDPGAMQGAGHTGQVYVSPAFGLTRGWQGDAAELFLDNIALDDIIDSAGSFRMVSPLPNSVVDGSTVFRVALGDLAGVSNVEYLLNGKQLYMDGESVLPQQNAPSYDLHWHTANWHDGPVTIEAVARDASGKVLGRTAPTPFKIANGTANVTLVSPDPSTTLSGPVPVTVRTDHVISHADQYHEWHLFVDGEDTPLGGTDKAQEHTFDLDTTKLPNGKHELFLVVRLADTALGYPILGAVQVTVNVDNGKTLMDLRSNYRDVFLVPSGHVRLTSQHVYTDGSKEDVPATFASSKDDVAMVDPLGKVTARARGVADITATYGDRTSVTRVTVRDNNDFPHFTKQGEIVGSYRPDSTFLRTVMHTSPPEMAENPNLGPAMQQAGVSALEASFYLNPADGQVRDFDNWKKKNDPFQDAIVKAADEHNLGIYLVGDSLVRTTAELYDSVCDNTDPEVTCAEPTSQAKILHALNRAADTRRVVGIDMVDEVDSMWGDTPTPSDGRWRTLTPPLKDNSFTKFMQTFSSQLDPTDPGKKRPYITWTTRSGASTNWTGNPAFSDYNGIYHTFQSRIRAYPSGGSTFQYVRGVDHSLFEGGTFLANAPSVLVASGTGPFYNKVGPGDHFTAGQDRLDQPGTQTPQVAAGIVYALIRGMAGVRVYGYDGTWWKNERANAKPGGTDKLQTGADPNGPGKQRWQSMSDAFNVIADFEPYLLQAPTNAIDLGDRVRTGARSGPQGKVLIALNVSETTETVQVDLSSYRTGKPITRVRLIGGAKQTTETIPSTPIDTLTLEPNEAVFWVSPN